MILECPSCHNRYLVDPRAVGAKGRTVRCAKCRYEWFAEPPREQPADDVLSVEDAVEKQEIPPIPKGSSVPVIAMPRGVPIGLKVATFSLAVLCLLVSLVFFHGSIIAAVPRYADVYAAMGMYSSEGVVFADLEYEKAAPEGDEKQFKDIHVFKGYLVNTSSQPRKVPNVLITLDGKDGQTLRRQPLVSSAVLAPGESTAFGVPLTTSPESLRHAIIELGSPYELYLR